MQKKPKRTELDKVKVLFEDWDLDGRQTKILWQPLVKITKKVRRIKS